MTDLRTAALRALEALEYIYTETTVEEDKFIHAASAALRAALAQPESEYELAGYSTLEHLVYLSRVVPSPDRIPIYVKPVIKNHQENV
jgi:hypothetical protein